MVDKNKNIHSLVTIISSLPESSDNALFGYEKNFPLSKELRNIIFRINNKSYDNIYSSLKLKFTNKNNIISIARKSALGDVIASTSVIKAIKKKYKDKKIYFYTSPSAAPLLLNNKDIDAIFMHANLKSNLPWQNIKYEQENPNVSIFDRMVQSVGLDTTDMVPILYLDDNEKEWGRNWRKSVCNKKTKLIGIHAGFTMPGKYWPQYKWYKLVEWLKSEKYSVVEFGSIGGYDSCIGLSAHGLPIRMVMSMIYQCDIVICVDSMIMHMANAMNKKCIPLFGSTDSKVYTPSNARSYPISSDSAYSKFHNWGGRNRWYTPCLNQDMENCMDSIEVKDVIDKLKEVVKL